MLFLQPLLRAVDLQAGAIDQDVDEPLLRDAIIVPLVRHSQPTGSTAQSRMVGNGEIQAHQLQYRSQQTFRLAQPQPEHQPKRQCRLDRQVGVAGLATACCPLWCLPAR